MKLIWFYSYSKAFIIAPFSTAFKIKSNSSSTHKVLYNHIPADLSSLILLPIVPFPNAIVPGFPTHHLLSPDLFHCCFLCPSPLLGFLELVVICLLTVIFFGGGEWGVLAYGSSQPRDWIWVVSVTCATVEATQDPSPTVTQQELLVICFFVFNFIDIRLTYNIKLISGVQCNDLIFVYIAK